MNISYYQRPFPYSIIDNFFDEDMLREVTKATSEQDIGLNKFTDELEVSIRKKYTPILLDIRNELLNCNKI